MRKKGSYHKNRPFRLLAVAALRFVQSYLNDIAHRGSIPQTGAVFLIFRVQLPQGFAELDCKQDGGAGHGDGIRHRLGGVDRHGLIRQ